MTVKSFLKVTSTYGSVIRICYEGSGPTCNRTLVTLDGGGYSSLWMGDYPKGKKTKILNSQIKSIYNSARPVNWETRKKWYALTTIYIDWDEASA